MTKIPEDYPLGDIEQMELKELAYVLQDMYRELAVAINARPTVIVRANQDGQTDETFLPVGTLNINQTGPKVEILTSHTNPTTVVWTTL